MSSESGYGQFCPLAMAAEFLCKRWTVLILRELLLGSNTFNDISRGVARMSRTLLSKRLKDLELRGLLVKRVKSNQRDTYYELTTSGKSLSKVVFGIADWSQEWLHIEPCLEDIDTDHLFWSLRRSAKHQDNLPNVFIVHIFLTDQAEQYQNAWLIIEEDQTELCIINNDYDVDVQIVSTARTLTEVFMGWKDFSESINSGKLVIKGLDKYVKNAKQWLGQSRLANIQKQPSELRVF